MDNIRIIYRILKTLEAAMDSEEFDYRVISAETLHISEQRLLSLLRMLVEAGMIEGLAIDIDAAGNFMVSESRPRLTLKGLEYLNENSLMQRAMKMAKGIKDSIPGI
ncbi:YjcQ protein [Selenomonas sp. FOBRC9]|uniref:YjcQ family protein n=1 Tax=Selenomonas sp. FOBRC9 TaxID=936573 RepID=UPI00027A6052|nr:YjcQ family protein [Selenomonas sp. FOBRC9]EJP32297.1 YjcQ protein [Selenomonas sp. FOBRC9]